MQDVESGQVNVKGQNVANYRLRQITEMSVAHIPEDRHRDGLILAMSVAENISLQTYYQTPLSHHGFLNYKAINRHARELMIEFDVRGASEIVPASALSGVYNQQKAVIAREIDRNPDLLIVSQPTRGLDVGAIEYIHKRLIQACGMKVKLS